MTVFSSGLRQYSSPQCRDAVDRHHHGPRLLRRRAVRAAEIKAPRFHAVDRRHQPLEEAVQYVIVGQRQEIHPRVAQRVQQRLGCVEPGEAGIGNIPEFADGGLRVGNGVIRALKRPRDQGKLRVKIIGPVRLSGDFQLLAVDHQLPHGPEPGDAQAARFGRRMSLHLPFPSFCIGQFNNPTSFA